MKRSWIYFIAVIFMLVLAGCGKLPHDAASTSTPKATDVAAAALPEGLAVICKESGGVCGGYFNGKWRTNSEVARWLDVPVTFYTYNLLGEGETVESEGVSYSDCEGGFVWSWTKDNHGDDSNRVYGLKIDERHVSYADSYTGYPLEYYLLYNLAPKHMPDINEVEDTSKAKSAIQGMLNKQFGKNAPEAEIIIAVSADIDSDGKRETVVNAANNEDNVYSYYCDKPLYCISCVIEDDGEIVVIDEYYLDSEYAADIYYNGEKSEEYDIEEGDDIAFYAYIRFFYIQNIIDLDNDGACELVLCWESWEEDETTVYKYENKTFGAVLRYGWGI